MRSDVTEAASKAAAQIEQQAVGYADKTWDYVVQYGPGVVKVLLLLALAWIFARWARRAVERVLQRAKFDLTLTKFFSNLVKWVILAVAAVAILGQFGVQTATFAAVFGATGLALGLALQGSLSHLAAGVMLLVFRPFKIGDGILVGGQSGVVNEIDLFTTSLDTGDGRRIIIPNGQIFGNVIENQTFHARRRVDLAIALAGDSDIDRCMAVLLEAAQATPGVLAEPGPAAVLVDLAGGGQNWSVQVWAKNAEVGEVRRKLAKRVREAITREQLSGPRPAMDVRVTAIEGLRVT